MENLREALEECTNEQLYQLIMSNAKNKTLATKVKVRPIMHKDTLVFQASSYVGTKVLHANYTKAELISYVMENLQDNFKQLEIEHVTMKVTVLVSKKGKVTIKKKKNTDSVSLVESKKIDLSHNRTKKYILEEKV